MSRSVSQASCCISWQSRSVSVFPPRSHFGSASTSTVVHRPPQPASATWRADVLVHERSSTAQRDSLQTSMHMPLATPLCHVSTVLHRYLRACCVPAPCSWICPRMHVDAFLMSTDTSSIFLQRARVTSMHCPESRCPAIVIAIVRCGESVQYDHHSASSAAAHCRSLHSGRAAPWCRSRCNVRL